MSIESHLRLSPRETDILGLARKIKLAKGIIERGGRTSIVRAVCQISKASALQFHKEIHGESAKAGQLPYDPEWIIKSPQNCIHASIYYNVYQTISKAAHGQATKGEIFLASYLLYEQIIETTPRILGINRAWHIGQQISMSSICGVRCDRCNSMFVSITYYPDIYKICPLCNSTKDSAGRQKWKMPNFNKEDICRLNCEGEEVSDYITGYIFHEENI